MAKPDFIGGAALERAERRPLVRGLSCASAEPMTWGGVFAGGAEIGRVTAAAWPPFLKHGTAIVRFAAPIDEACGAIEVKTRSIGRLPARIAALPFYDAEQSIVRGRSNEIP